MIFFGRSNMRSRQWKMLEAGPIALLVVAAALIFGSLLVGVSSKLYWAGDYAIFMVDMFHASEFQQALGISSRFGWAHPGPINYYLLLPWYWLSSAGEQGLVAGTFFYNTLFLMGATCIVGFLAGRVLAALFIISAVGFIYVSMGAGSFFDVLLPSATLFPWLLAVTLASLVAIKGLRYTPLLVVTLTYVTQMHVAFWVPSAVLGLSAVGLSVYHKRPMRMDVIYGVASLILGFALWLPPILQIENLRAIFDFFLSRPASEHTAWDAFRALLVLAGQPLLGEFLHYQNVGSELPSLVLGGLLFGGLLIGTVLAFLKKEIFARALAVILILQILVYTFALTRVAGPILPHSISFFPLISVFIILQLATVLVVCCGKFYKILPVCLVGFTVLGSVVAVPGWISAIEKVKRPDESVKELYGRLGLEVNRCGASATIFMNQENWNLVIGAVSELYRSGEDFSIYPVNWRIVFGGRVPSAINECQIRFSTGAKDVSVLRDSDDSPYDLHLILDAKDMGFAGYGPAKFDLENLSIQAEHLVDAGLVSRELVLPVGRYKVVGNFAWDVVASNASANAAHFSIHGREMLSSIFTSKKIDAKITRYIESDGHPFRISFGLGGWSVGKGVISMKSLGIYSINAKK